MNLQKLTSIFPLWLHVGVMSPSKGTDSGYTSNESFSLSWLEAGMTQDYSLSSCWPLGFDFISSFLCSLHPFISFHISVSCSSFYSFRMSAPALSAPSEFVFLSDKRFKASYCAQREAVKKKQSSSLFFGDFTEMDHSWFTEAWLKTPWMNNTC